MGWVDPWVGLSCVGLGRVEIFQFLVGWVRWVHYIGNSTKNLVGKLSAYQINGQQLYWVGSDWVQIFPLVV